VTRLAALALTLPLVAAGEARADGILVPGDYPHVTVQVGKTVEQDVGYRRGRWFCDDPSILTAELVTRGETNKWIVTGVKAGSTQCRVGTEREGYNVYNVFVTARPPGPRPNKAEP
jgi:hypothetical protein